MLDRRQVLGLGTAAMALAAWPAYAAGERDAELTALLDSIAKPLTGLTETKAIAATASDGARRLSAFAEDGLSPIRKRERTVILAGLTAEGRMAQPSFAERLTLAYGAPIGVGQAKARLEAEVAATNRLIDPLLRRRGLTHGSVAERLSTMFADPALAYPEGEAGRRMAISDMNRALSDVFPRLPLAFGDMPLLHSAIMEGVPGRTGVKDAKTATYHVNITNLKIRPSWTLRDQAFHEATPGHLIQMPLQEAVQTHPLRVRYSAGIMEGWPIYAEQLAHDLGMYRKDLLGEIGHYQWRLFRMARGLADIGVGAGRSEEQTNAFMLGIHGFEVAWTTNKDDIQRMARDPARSTAEALTALDVSAWRPRQQPQWPAFHRALLDTGPWPGAELRKLVGAA
jgi:hypothetical protein